LVVERIRQENDVEIAADRPRSWERPDACDLQKLDLRSDEDGDLEPEGFVKPFLDLPFESLDVRGLADRAGDLSWNENVRRKRRIFLYRKESRS